MIGSVPGSSQIDGVPEGKVEEGRWVSRRRHHGPQYSLVCMLPWPPVWDTAMDSAMMATRADSKQSLLLHNNTAVWCRKNGCPPRKEGPEKPDPYCSKPIWYQIPQHRGSPAAEQPKQITNIH